MTKMQLRYKGAKVGEKAICPVCHRHCLPALATITGTNDGRMVHAIDVFYCQNCDSTFKTE